MSVDIEYLGFRIGQLRHLSPREAYEAAKGGAVFVDVRQTYETHYKGFDVDEIIYIDHEEIKDSYNNCQEINFL